MTVTVQLFGRPRLLLEGAWSEPAPTKPLCLALHLAFVGDWVGREQLAFLFWPDSEDAIAKGNLRQLLRRARALDLPGAIEVDGERLRYSVGTDVQAFRAAMAANRWEEAIDLYRGPLLDGTVQCDSEAFSSWLELERETLQGAWREATVRQAEELERSGAYDRAATLLQQLLETEFLAEDVLQHYLRSAYLAGQREAALRTYERFARGLAEELDLEPLPDTLELVATIRQTGALPDAPAARHEKPDQLVPLSVLRPPRLIGREAALARLEEAATPVVAIAGEAGMGKSRLLTQAAPEGYLLRCQEGMEQIPFYPLAGAIRRDLKQGRSVPELGPYLQDLARLVPEVAPHLRPEPAAADTSHSRLLEALARYLEEVSGGTLLVDDLQWADSATLDVFLHLSGHGNTRLLATFRKHEKGDHLQRMLSALRTRQLISEIALEPLGEDEVARLLATLIGIDEGPPRFSRWLHARTGGNPMFLLETLKALFESGTLNREAAGWSTPVDEITRDYSELEVPEAVSQVVARRVARLSQETNRILRCAAVAGQEFGPRLLAQVSGLSELGVLEALGEAESAGLIQGDRFSHDLLRESVYASLVQSQRRLLHARVAEALPDHGDPSVRAEHWLAAQEPVRAVALWRQAAEGFRRQGLFEPAIALLRRALDHADPGRQADLRATLAEHLQQAGHNAEALEMTDLLLQEDPSPSLRAAALNTRAVVLLREGQVEAAARAVASAQQLLAGGGDERLHTGFTMTRAMLYHAQGDYRAAGALLEPLLGELRKNPVGDDICMVLSSLAANHDMLGEAEKALPLHQEALRLARANGFRYFHIDAALNLLYCLMDLGRSEEAIPIAEEALKLGQFENTPTLRSNLATACLELGRYGEARDHYRTVVSETEHSFLRAIAWARLAETHARLGEGQEVTAAVEEAILEGVQTDFMPARVRVLIAAFRHGTDEQKARLRPWFAELASESLPGYLRNELEQARSE